MDAIDLQNSPQSAMSDEEHFAMCEDLIEEDDAKRESADYMDWDF